MPATGWAPQPLCGKCFHWKTSPPTECLQTQLLSSKAASTTDWEPFLMQIHIILLGNSRCSAMLSFRKIRTLLSPPPSCTRLLVSFNRSHPQCTLGCLPGCEVQISALQEWDSVRYWSVNMTFITHAKSYMANAHSTAYRVFPVWWVEVFFPTAWPPRPSVAQIEVKIQGKHFITNFVWLVELAYQKPYQQRYHITLRKRQRKIKWVAVEYLKVAMVYIKDMWKLAAHTGSPC